MESREWGHTYLPHKICMRNPVITFKDTLFPRVYENFELYLINMTDWSVMFINDQRSNTINEV